MSPQVEALLARLGFELRTEGGGEQVGARRRRKTFKIQTYQRKLAEFAYP
jgi:hypothetical protein